jgi:hypothetical protein
MAKKTPTTEAATTPAAKEQTHTTVQGYAVRIIGFIAVPKNDLDAQVAAAQAVKAAVQSGDISGLAGIMTVEKVAHDFVGRRVPLPTEPAAEDQDEGEGDGTDGTDDAAVIGTEDAGE